MNRDFVANLIALLRRQERPLLAFAQRSKVDATRSLGVLSASFNPLTNAHVRMLEVAHEAFQFDEWLLLLALANVDKPIEGFDIEDRIAFLQAWAASQPRASIALCSHGRFVEKVEAIRGAGYGDEVKIRFIVGHDTLVRLFDPKYYRDMSSELAQLFARCEFIAMNRGGCDTRVVREFLARPQVVPFAPKIHVMELDADAASLSATQVRERLRTGGPVDGLVPAEVALQLRR